MGCLFWFFFNNRVYLQTTQLDFLGEHLLKLSLNITPDVEHSGSGNRGFSSLWQMSLWWITTYSAFLHLHMRTHTHTLFFKPFPLVKFLSSTWPKITLHASFQKFCPPVFSHLFQFSIQYSVFPQPFRNLSWEQWFSSLSASHSLQNLNQPLSRPIKEAARPSWPQ